MTYRPLYTSRFKKNYETFQNMQPRIDRIVAQVIEDPYIRTEQLTEKGKLNLRGCRSARVGRNFRIIFVICEECMKEPDCEYCPCESLPPHTVVFLTVGPHERAYSMS